MPSIYDLPDEILLEVVRCLGAIHSSETQSEAFKHKRIEKERQRENFIRKQALYALCLTSHRMRCLSSPTLYASSSTCATRSGLKQLQLLHRTMAEPANALSPTKRFAEYLQYVENRLADFRGNSLQDDEGFQQDSVATYFQLLASLVLCAPNIEQLCVVSLEHDDVSFWTNVLGNPSGAPYQGFSKLAQLSAQIHTLAWSSLPGISILEQILQLAQSLLMLSDLRVSGATTTSEHLLDFQSDEITNLRRLDLTECNLEFVETANLLQACRNLRHFTCKWEFVKDTHVGPSVLRPALLARADTLESLSLDWREVRYNTLIEPGSSMIGSLRTLENLKDLEICELGFLGDWFSILELPGQPTSFEISELLPASLQSMVLLAKGDVEHYDDDVLKNARCLWQFSKHCEQATPHLKSFCIKSKKRMCTITSTALSPSLNLITITIDLQLLQEYTSQSYSISSVRAGAMPTSGFIAEVSTDLPETPPVLASQTKITIDTPPHSPVTEVRSLYSTPDPDTADTMPDQLVTQNPQSSGMSMGTGNGLGDEKSLEISGSTTPADSERTEVASTATDDDQLTSQKPSLDTTDVQLPTSTSKKEDTDVDTFSPDQNNSVTSDITLEGNTSCTPQSGDSVAQEILPAIKDQISATPRINHSEEAGALFGAKDDTQKDGNSHLCETSGEANSDISIQDNLVKTTKQACAALEQPQSLPPHLRPTSKPLNTHHASTSEVKRDWPAQKPRLHRVHQPTAYQPLRPPFDHDELQRTKARLMKADNDLEILRKANAEMRKTVEAEQQASISNAMSGILTDLLQKQADALTAKAKAQEKERELQYRERKIAQLEVYLSEGQKQLKYELEKQGIRLMSVLDESNMRREAELKVKHQFSDIEGKIAIQVERLRHQEAAQKVREQQYKIQIRDELDTDTRKQSACDTDAKIVEGRLTEAAYERGLADGQKVGSAAANQNALRQGFLQGYDACYRTHAAFYDMRNGRVAADSPQVAFLYDPTHPENPYNIGLDIGRMKTATASPRSDAVCAEAIQAKSSHPAIMNDPQADSDVVKLSGKEQVCSKGPGPYETSQAAGRSEDTHSAQSERLGKAQKLEIQTRSTLPPKATFAGELRGSSSSAMTKSIFATTVSATNGSSAAVVAECVGNGVSKGRNAINYDEDSGVEPESPNLIDLC
ncbi:hypothetical protein OPT61_g6883 [Boeremia exigua]|uniref:Uncharacterized protein n=1 Tax=Boeremia exigua TaxID=749465 RepID=A0ACC2I4M7_9PLEO|nr:hypothetical protein OPT61_g6883 [Boeremia exigua]